MSLIESCPLFRGSLIERLQCIHKMLDSVPHTSFCLNFGPLESLTVCGLSFGANLHDREHCLEFLTVMLLGGYLRHLVYITVALEGFQKWEAKY